MALTQGVFMRSGELRVAERVDGAPEEANYWLHYSHICQEKVKKVLLGVDT